jgi:hypothetical protein
LLAIGLTGLFIGGEAIRLWVAETLAVSFKLPKLLLALKIDPADPRIHKLLGQYYCYLDDPNMAEGLKHLRRATELSPSGAIYLYSLASACELASDHVCADQAFERAVSLSPMMPRFEWAAANHYLVTDRTDQALARFRRLLELDPGYAGPTFKLCLRVTGDPELVFQKVLLPGKDSMLKLSYVAYLSAEGKADAAHQIWVKTMATASSFPLSSAEPYLEYLLAHRRGQEARNIWQDLERLGVVSIHKTVSSDNLVFNGDFEQIPLNAGLDWRYSVAPYLYLDFFDPTAYQGTRCMRMDFTVSRNEEYLGVFQYVPVSSNQEYILQAFVRSQSITSDSGPRLRVLDPACPTCLDATSDTTVGTTAWHQIDLKFTTGPNTQLVILSVIRPRSRTFPMEITGSFWLDAVSLKPADSVGDQPTLKPAH